MGYEMTRPAQKWLGAGAVFAAFFLLLFTMAVPYVNHFGQGTSLFTYYTKWSGRWRSDLDAPNSFNPPSELFNFPQSAPIFIGIGILLAIIGGIYLFWLTYSNKPCYFTRERPGPIPGTIMFVSTIFYFIGNLIYEKWAYGAPRPLKGWYGTEKFYPETVHISPTFWIGLVIGFVILALSTISVIYYLDTLQKRPVK